MKESLTTAQINPEMSIIDDLGLDSLDLTELAARIRADIGAIDFLPWLAQVPAGGGTVASLAEFVAAAQPERRGRGVAVLPTPAQGTDTPAGLVGGGMDRTVVGSPSAPDYLALARTLAPAFAERAAGYDRAAEFPHENWKDLVRTGYTKMTVPVAYGGGGADLGTLCRAQQVLAAACGSTAFAINMHVHGLAMIEAVTGEASRWAYRAVAGEGAIIAGGFSEPGVGGNWWHPTTVARPTAGGYLLRGRKSFFTGLPGASLLFLTAALDDDRGIPQPVAFLVPRPEQGLNIIQEWDAAGMRATGSHTIELDDLFVESRYLLGEPGDLALLFMSAVHWAWCSFSAVFAGIARGALDEVAKSMCTRTLQVISKPLAHLPGVQFKVAEMATRLAAAEAYLYAAVEADHSAMSGDPLSHYIEMSLMKTTVCRLAHEVVTLALQVQGGSALLSGSSLQRMYRDVTAGLLIPPMPDVVHEWAGKEALGVPILAEPRWGG